MGRGVTALKAFHIKMGKQIVIFAQINNFRLSARTWGVSDYPLQIDVWLDLKIVNMHSCENSQRENAYSNFDQIP